MSVNTKMTAIADEIRTLTNTDEPMGLDDMATNLDTTNTAVNTQEGLIAQIQLSLTGKVGKELSDERKEEARKSIDAVSLEEVVAALDGKSSNILQDITWAAGYPAGYNVGNGVWFVTDPNQCPEGEAYTVDPISVVAGETYVLTYNFTPTTSNKEAWWAIHIITATNKQSRLVLPKTDYIDNGDTIIYKYEYTPDENVVSI